MKAFRLVSVGSTLVLAVLGTVAVGPAAAATATLHCGDAVTTNTTLAADVGPCTGPGLVITASNVTLDLGTHHVIGTLSPNPDPNAPSVADLTDVPGIRLARVKGVTVTNGVVEKFSAGVAVVRGSNNTIKRLQVRDNIGPGRTANFGDGILVDGSAANTIVDNEVGPHNGPFDGIGVSGAGANNNRIVRNTIENNDVPAIPDPTNTGQAVVNDSGVIISGDVGVVLTGNAVQLNKIWRNGASGILLLQRVQNSVVSSNDIEGNGFANVDLAQGATPVGPPAGISMSFVSYNTIVSNVVKGNAKYGILNQSCCGFRGPPPGLTVDQVGGHNKFLNNDAAGNNLDSGGGKAVDLRDALGLNAGKPCFTDVWSGNKWGPLGTINFFGDPSLANYASIFPRCVGNNGSGPPVVPSSP